jgi:DNA-binding response OmpR family regulator
VKDMKLLIVDDNPDNIEILKYKLRQVDSTYNIMESHTGLDAIEKVKKDIPDIILLDIMMPGMDGFEVAKTIKKIFPDNFIPIIMVTAREDVDSKIRGLASGGDDYLTKPFEITELQARIKSLMRIRELQNKIAEMNKKILVSERLSAVVATVATLNHEINNPLCSMLLDLQMLQLNKEFNAIPIEIQEKIKKIETSAARIADITKKLSDLQEISIKEYIGKSEILDVDK